VAYKGKKMRKKGPTKFKMKGIDPQKNICFANIKKMSRPGEGGGVEYFWTMILKPYH
jgi:hypothetical protein